MGQVLTRRSSPSANGRRERRRRETQERIMRAAVALFEKHGYPATTVEHITAAADVAKGTFFNYFPSKEHLMLFLFENISREFERLEAGVETARDLRAYLQSFAHSFLDHPLRTPVLVRTVIGVAISDPIISGPFRETVQRGRQAVAAVMRAAQTRGQARADLRPELLGRNFQQFIFGTEVLCSLEPKEDVHDWVDTMFEIFWEGASVPANGKRKRKEKVQ